MSGVRIGSLCSGYGGLEMGVQAVYGGTTAWVRPVHRRHVADVRDVREAVGEDLAGALVDVA